MRVHFANVDPGPATGTAMLDGTLLGEGVVEVTARTLSGTAIEPSADY